MKSGTKPAVNGSEPAVNGRVVPHTTCLHRHVSAELAITPRVSVVIPVLNEAANLPHVFESLPAWANEIVLVDGGSTDDTIAVARRLLPDVTVVVQPGMGKGDALLAGFAACGGDIIVTVDGDGSTDGRELIRFVSALAAGADFAKGSRFVSGGGSDDLTFSRRIGNRVFSVLVNRMFGTRFTDLCYGYNAFWRRHLPAMAIDCSGFEVEALMHIRAASAGLSIQEVPSFERARIHGASNLRVVRDGCRILALIVRERLRSRSRQAAGDSLARPPGDGTAEKAAVPAQRTSSATTSMENRGNGRVTSPTHSQTGH